MKIYFRRRALSLSFAVNFARNKKREILYSIEKPHSLYIRYNFPVARWALTAANAHRITVALAVHTPAKAGSWAHKALVRLCTAHHPATAILPLPQTGPCAIGLRKAHERDVVLLPLLLRCFRRASIPQRQTVTCACVYMGL